MELLTDIQNRRELTLRDAEKILASRLAGRDAAAKALISDMTHEHTAVLRDVVRQISNAVGSRDGLLISYVILMAKQPERAAEMRQALTIQAESSSDDLLSAGAIRQMSHRGEFIPDFPADTRDISDALADIQRLSKTGIEK